MKMKEFKKNKCGLFATKDSLLEAYEDSMAMLKAEGVPDAIAATAIHTLVNTIIAELEKQ